MIAGHKTQSREHWETPPELFDPLNLYFKFTLDVCATTENTKVQRFFSPEEDGLTQSWSGERCWMNPPYLRGVVEKWVGKAVEETLNGSCLVVGLIPVDTSTRWWHNHVMRAESIWLLPRRVRFLTNGKPIGSPPFASCIVIWTISSVRGYPTLRTWDWC
jgi:phage N-6-adenine-methyltransferase